MDKPLAYANAPEEIKESARNIVESFGADHALMEGAIVSAIWHAILKAKNDAYDEASKVAFFTNVPDQTAMEIAQAIRNLKHKE